jgi:hypothetical protein
MTTASPRSPGPPAKQGRLAKPLDIEHVFVPDREAMAAALRVVLGLPRVLPASPVGRTT